MTPEQIRDEVTRLISLLGLARPDLVTKHPRHVLRRMAVESLQVAERQLSIPAPFLRAFAGEDR